MQFSHSYCAICKKHDVVTPLHDEAGGPKCCMVCKGKWHAEHGRRRRLGRIVIRAMAAFLDGGGRVEDLQHLQITAIGKKYFDIDPLGYLAGIANTKDQIIELTSELLTDTLKLVHPDHQPLERRELARRVTAQLLALQPFVFPAPKPKPRAVGPSAGPSGVVTAFSKVSAEPLKKPLRYPCEKCAADVPYFYCAACRAEYDRRQSVERQHTAAQQREWYAQRKLRRDLTRKPTTCSACGTKFKGKRKDARFCSTKCRQQAHRQRASAPS